MRCVATQSRATRRATGLLSDNVAKVVDDGESLWLSTTRGICRVSKKQLAEFTAGTRKRLEPENYGVEDGLRSAQCAPTYPLAGGGMRSADGRLWFTTSRGLAVLDPGAHKPTILPPLTSPGWACSPAETCWIRASRRASSRAGSVCRSATPAFT